MIFDFESQSARANLDQTYDVCICGAGPAGISLAMRLENLGLNVILLEGGALEYTDASQELYQGEIGGIEYFDLDIGRVRQFGGSTNHWGGWVRELDKNDFLERKTVPLSGWPIRREDLDPYSEAAGKMIEIENVPRTRGTEDFPYEEGMEGFDSIVFTETEAINFGEKYLPHIEKSEKLHCLYNCNVLDLHLDDTLSSAQYAVCASYENPDKFQVKAKYFVVAMGGIENARFLLNANNQMPDGIGNSKGNVGRYFSEHPDVWAGSYFLRDDVLNPNEPIIIMPQREWGLEHETLRYCLYFSAAEKEVHLNTGSIKEMLEEWACKSDIGIEIWRLLRWRRKAGQARCKDDFEEPEGFPSFGQIHITTEQSLNADSRVTLSDEKDRFGLRRARLEWNLTDQDYFTMKQSVIQFGEWLAEKDMGRARMANWLAEDQPLLPSIKHDHVAHHHHMCTTRMADDPQFGVVDKDCKVFGIENLYMAGSSCFSTGGFGNPTYDLIKLSLRLADHLGTKFQ